MKCFDFNCFNQIDACISALRTNSKSEYKFTVVASYGGWIFLTNLF